MKVGDLVRHNLDSRVRSAQPGLVVDIIQKKCWRTHVQGKKIDWNKVDPEPHAVVLYSPLRTLSIPIVDLEVIDETS